jgi:hypothetical protein
MKFSKHCIPTISPAVTSTKQYGGIVLRNKSCKEVYFISLIAYNQFMCSCDGITSLGIIMDGMSGPQHTMEA